MGAAALHPQEKDILIVGAGPTGLGAAWRLRELADRGVINPSIDWLLTDKSDNPGGMAVSVSDEQGFTWDLGGHIIFSHYKYFDALLDELIGGDILQHPRKSWVRMYDRFIPFPIQHNLHHLPPKDAARCLKDLVGGRPVPRNGYAPEDFEEWLFVNFGRALSELFFLPYNYKMWAHPANELSTVWTARKSGSRYANVPLVDIERLVENFVCGRDDPGWVGATTFPYPKNGGIGALWRELFRRLPAERTALSQRLVAVDPDGKIATFASGLRVKYRHLITTVPLPDLLAAMPERSEEYRATTPLSHSRTHVVGVGLRGPLPAALADKFWLYVPDPEVPYFRVTVISNFSPNNVPSDVPHWSLMCESSESPHLPVDEARLMENVVRALRASLLPADQPIVARWYRRLDYGYPAPCLKRDGFLRDVEPKLRRKDIRTRGRFGGWKYETSNQDNGFMQGVEATDSVLFGTEEVSYFHSELIAKGAISRILPTWGPARAPRPAECLAVESERERELDVA